MTFAGSPIRELYLGPDKLANMVYQDEPYCSVIINTSIDSEKLPKLRYLFDPNQDSEDEKRELARQWMEDGLIKMMTKDARDRRSSC